MKPRPAPPDAFGTLGASEAAIIAALDAMATGLRQLDVTPGGEPVRAAFLRWVLLEALPAMETPVPRIVLRGTTIDGRLDLAAGKLGVILRLVSCDLGDGADLSDAQSPGFEMFGGHLGGLMADRVTVGGSLRLCSAEFEAPGPGHGPGASPLDVIGVVRVNGAKIRGNLDLRGALLTVRRPGTGPTVALWGDGASVEGNLFLGQGCALDGEARLNGCKVSRNLDARGGRLFNPGDRALSLAGAGIDGTAYLCTDPATGVSFTTWGEVLMDGARVQGPILLIGARLHASAFPPIGRRPIDLAPLDRPSASPLLALTAEGLKAAASVRMTDAAILGRTVLTTASVGGDLDATRASLSFAGEVALAADGVTVAGVTQFDEARIDGVLGLSHATFKQGLSFAGLRIERAIARALPYPPLDAFPTPGPDGACGVNAMSSAIAGGFTWTEVQVGDGVQESDGSAARPAWLSLLGAKIDVVDDDEGSWDGLDRIELRDCEYQQIENYGAGPWDARLWRLRRLDREYAPLNAPPDAGWWQRIAANLRVLRWTILGSERLDEGALRFSPQPYAQFASVAAKAGFASDATAILVQLERDRTRHGKYGVRGLLGRWWLNVVLRHGTSPFRPVYALLIWAAVSAVSFQAGYLGGRIIPTSPPKDGAKPTVTFNAIVYALDTLVPIVNLGQKTAWVVNPLTADACPAEKARSAGRVVACTWAQWPDRWVSILVLFNFFFGWAMTSFFAAGLSGLLRKS